MLALGQQVRLAYSLPTMSKGSSNDFTGPTKHQMQYCHLTVPFHLFRFTYGPLGKNSIGQILPFLSEHVGLSKRYPNHSLRATYVTFCLLIMARTGHTSEKGISSSIVISRLW